MIQFGDLFFQPALIAPPILASCLAVLSVYSLFFVRGLDMWSVRFFFPSREVGPGDVAVAAALLYVLIRAVAKYFNRSVADRRRRTHRRYGPTLWSAVFISHGTFGIHVWGAAAGIAMRRSRSSALATTAYTPVAAAFFICTAYHVIVWTLTVVFLSPFGAIVMLLLGRIGPVGCLGDSLKCEVLVSSGSDFFNSIYWMAGSAVFWLWISDLWLGFRRILATRRTLRQIDFGLIHDLETVPPPGAAIEILHLSDLHVVATEQSSRSESFGKEPRGNTVLRSRFEELCGESERSDILVLSGDLTDTGAFAEWEALQSIVANWPQEIRQKTFIIPGNHDINFVTHMRRMFRHRDTIELHGRHMRQALFARFAAQFVQPGDEVAFLTDAGEVLLCSAQRWFDERREDMDAYLQAVGAGELPQTTGNAYTWQVPVSVRRFSKGGIGLALIGIDTSNWGLTTFSNALGTDSGRFQELVARCASALVGEGYLPIIVGHHAMIPIYERGQKIGGGRVEPFLVAAASQLYGDTWFENLVREIPKPGFLYLHGHRHVARCIGTEFVSGHRAYLLGAPSLLFGDEWDGQSTKVASRHSIRVLIQTNGSPSEEKRLWVSTSDVYGQSAHAPTAQL